MNAANGVSWIGQIADATQRRNELLNISASSNNWYAFAECFPALLEKRVGHKVLRWTMNLITVDPAIWFRFSGNRTIRFWGKMVPNQVFKLFEQPSGIVRLQISGIELKQRIGYFSPARNTNQQTCQSRGDYLRNDWNGSWHIAIRELFGQPKIGVLQLLTGHNR